MAFLARAHGMLLLNYAAISAMVCMGIYHLFICIGAKISRSVTQQGNLTDMTRIFWGAVVSASVKPPVVDLPLDNLSVKTILRKCILSFLIVGKMLPDQQRQPQMFSTFQHTDFPIVDRDCFPQL